MGRFQRSNSFSHAKDSSAAISVEQFRAEANLIKSEEQSKRDEQTDSADMSDRGDDQSSAAKSLSIGQSTSQSAAQSATQCEELSPNQSLDKTSEPNQSLDEASEPNQPLDADCEPNQSLDKTSEPNQSLDEGSEQSQFESPGARETNVSDSSEAKADEQSSVDQTKLTNEAKPSAVDQLSDSDIANESADQSKVPDFEKAQSDQAAAAESVAVKVDEPLAADRSERPNTDETEVRLVSADRPEVSDSSVVKGPLSADSSQSDSTKQIDNASNVEVDLSEPAMIKSPEALNSNYQAIEDQPREARQAVESTATPSVSKVNGVSATGPPYRAKEFHIMNIPKVIQRQLYQMGIRKPYRLQQELMPCLLNPGHSPDIFLSSSPNSGKKTAFIITALANIDSFKFKSQVVVICPTPNLAKKSTTYAKKIAANSKTRIEFATLSDRPTSAHLVFTTIDKLACFELLDANDLKQVYLDELDVLFKAEDTDKRLDKFLASLSPDCQLIGASSTFADDTLTRFSQLCAAEPKCIKLIDKEAYFNNLIQFRVNLSEEMKISALIQLVHSNPRPRCLCYAADASSTRDILGELQCAQVHAYRVASDMSFSERDKSISQFYAWSARKSKVVLVVEHGQLAGYFMERASLTVNYDLKLDEPNDYLYRVAQMVSSTKPKFVVNLVDEAAAPVVGRLETYFDFRLIELNVNPKPDGQV